MFRRYLEQAIDQLDYYPPGILTRRDIVFENEIVGFNGGFAVVTVGKWYSRKIAIKRIKELDPLKHKKVACPLRCIRYI